MQAIFLIDSSNSERGKAQRLSQWQVIASTFLILVLIKRTNNILVKLLVYISTLIILFN